MSILYVLIPLGLVLLLIGIWAFFWAVGSGQFDDLETPGWSVLIDHDKPPAKDGEDRPQEGSDDGR
jgi:cbb3-type cytochrome oxidase maturation protein